MPGWCPSRAGARSARTPTPRKERAMSEIVVDFDDTVGTDDTLAFAAQLAR
jgi:hypothetical protein